MLAALGVRGALPVSPLAAIVDEIVMNDDDGAANAAGGRSSTTNNTPRAKHDDINVDIGVIRIRIRIRHLPFNVSISTPGACRDGSRPAPRSGRGGAAATVLPSRPGITDICIPINIRRDNTGSKPSSLPDSSVPSPTRIRRARDAAAAALTPRFSLFTPRRKGKGRGKREEDFRPCIVTEEDVIIRRNSNETPAAAARKPARFSRHTTTISQARSRPARDEDA
jgi:hypothetical protein